MVVFNQGSIVSSLLNLLPIIMSAFYYFYSEKYLCDLMYFSKG